MSDRDALDFSRLRPNPWSGLELGQPLKTKYRTLKRARDLRRKMTPAEIILWSRMQDDALGGHRFVHQHPIGPYVADFACRRHKLVIELDGETHSSPDERRHDARRTAFLEREGWTVIRFWNSEVHTNLQGVLETILHRLPPKTRRTRQRSTAPKRPA